MRRLGAGLPEPAERDGAAVVAREALWRVEVAVVEQAIAGGVANEGLVLHLSEVVGDAAVVRDVEEAAVAEVEEFRALPHVAGVLPVADQEWPAILPVDEVVARVEERRTADIIDAGAHDLVPGVAVLPDAVVAELCLPVLGLEDVGVTGGGLDDGVVGVLLPRSQARIVTPCEARELSAAVPPGVEYRRRPIVVDEAAGPAAIGVGTVRVGGERDRFVVPVDEVVADGVSPVDAVVVGASGVVLVEDVEPAIPLADAVRVVQPVRRRCDVEPWPVDVSGVRPPPNIGEVVRGSRAAREAAVRDEEPQRVPEEGVTGVELVPVTLESDSGADGQCGPGLVVLVPGDDRCLMGSVVGADDGGREHLTGSGYREFVPCVWGASVAGTRVDAATLESSEEVVVLVVSLHEDAGRFVSDVLPDDAWFDVVDAEGDARGCCSAGEEEPAAGFTMFGDAVCEFLVLVRVGEWVPAVPPDDARPLVPPPDGGCLESRSGRPLSGVTGCRVGGLGHVGRRDSTTRRLVAPSTRRRAVVEYPNGATIAHCERVLTIG